MVAGGLVALNRRISELVMEEDALFVQCVPFTLMLPMFTSTLVESVDTPSQPNR